MPTLADTTVWIDYLQGRQTPQVELLDRELAAEDVLLADLVAMEVLQGLRGNTRSFDHVRSNLLALHTIAVGGIVLAMRAAENYRLLRTRGITIQSSTDCLIATFCINAGLDLLHNDSDFDGFEEHLGLRVVR